MGLTGLLLVDTSVSWADSDPQDTAKDIEVGLAGSLDAPLGKYLVVVRNPSTVTALTVVVKHKESAFGGADRHAVLQTAAVLVNTPEGEAFIVDGWLLAEGGRLTLSNDTVLGVGDAFTADVRVRRF